MRALMRSFDWAQSALGPVETWSPTLRTVSQLLLSNSFPILLWWGPDFIQLYNDAYIPVLGDKHPHRALGKPFRECWSEVYNVLGPLAEVPFGGGPSTWIDDIPVELNRYSYKEEAHFTISYSSVPDPSATSGIGGVIAIVNEISAKIVGGRRILALRDLASRSADVKTAEEACAGAAITLASYRKDAAFVLVYLLDEDQRTAHLAGQAEIEDCSAICPAIIELRVESSTWPFQQAAVRNEIVIVSDLASRFGRVPQGPWSDPPNSAAVIPIKSQTVNQPAGFLVVGISSRLRFDDDYRVFLELASAQIATSITNARAYEMERRRNEALAEVDRAKTVFFTNISHEFRTPLTLILGPLQDILANSDRITLTDRERLELMHRNALRLLKLVNALLDFSRIESGRIKASFEPLDFAQLVGDLASVFRSAIERAGLKFLVDCKSIPSPVYVDREMFEKIVFNLLSNAFKYTFEGEIGIQLETRGEGVELTVSDTGTGIPPEEVPELFKRFHRVRGARSRSYEGSGIGLALVQELVRLHGGSIRIESEVNRGSRFIVSIPLGAAHLPADWVRNVGASDTASHVSESYIHEAERWLANGPAEDIPDVPKLNAEKELVLVADDNADMREYVLRILSHRYRVETASNGAQALEFVGSRHPDLVLADVMMPELDGFALLAAIRSSHELKATPVILLSARAGEESRVDGLLAGADDYMVKPFSARELMARAESHLALARLRRETEREIRESEERFRAFVAASSDVVYRMSPDWKTMHHLDGRQFIASTDSPDQSWMERYILPEDHAIVAHAIDRAIRNKTVFQLEHRVVRTDGTVGWTFSRAVPLLNTNGEIIEWFGAATDITARKQSENALLLSERLASIGRMAATISHEINNPLEALSNLLYIARYSENVPQVVSEILAEADVQLGRVAHITRQALGFYRESTSPAPANVNTLMESVIDLLKGKLDQKRISIAKQWRSSCQVVGVAGELRQIFSNLLANSIDAVDTGGRIVIRISCCKLRDCRPGVRITVADNGKGIEPASKERIFEPLYTTKGNVGTGLGLWVTKQIVDKHKGTIKMHSSTGGSLRGTVFCVFLPE